MRDLWINIQQPEYQHILINHLPLTGLFVAALVLMGGLIAKSRPVILTGLIAVLLTSASVSLVMNTGKRADDRVMAMADSDGDAWLHHHEELAESWGKLYYLTAAAACVALLTLRLKPDYFEKTSTAVMLLALLSLIAGGWIAESGGKIRHREFRNGSPPPEETSHH